MGKKIIQITTTTTTTTEDEEFIAGEITKTGVIEEDITKAISVMDSTEIITIEVGIEAEVNRRRNDRGIYSNNNFPDNAYQNNDQNVETTVETTTDTSGHVEITQSSQVVH